VFNNVTKWDDKSKEEMRMIGLAGRICYKLTVNPNPGFL